MTTETLQSQTPSEYSKELIKGLSDLKTGHVVRLVHGVECIILLILNEYNTEYNGAVGASILFSESSQLSPGLTVRLSSWNVPDMEFL